MSVNFRKIFLAVIVVAAIIGIYKWGTGTPVETVKVHSNEVTLKKGETREVVEYYYPDESWYRYKLVSDDSAVVETLDDKLSVKGVSAGSTTVKCCDKNKVLETIKITVVE